MTKNTYFWFCLLDGMNVVSFIKVNPLMKYSSRKKVVFIVDFNFRPALWGSSCDVSCCYKILWLSKVDIKRKTSKFKDKFVFINNTVKCLGKCFSC